MEAIMTLQFVPGIPVTAWMAGFLALATYVMYVFYEWYRLSHVPGPFWASISRYWMVKESFKMRQPTAIKELNDKYGTFHHGPLSFDVYSQVILGSLVRIGPNELATDDPEILRRMMAVRSSYTRSPCKSWEVVKCSNVGTEMR